MRTYKTIFGVAGALVPIGYCGYLLYYFWGVSGSVHEAEEIGLAPTLLGLGVVALLFCIPLVFKIRRLFGGPRSPRSGGSAPEDDDDDGGAAADAIVARYLAQRSAQAAAAPPARPALQSSGPARRPSFGRKNG
jgi:hypothetical protein